MAHREHDSRKGHRNPKSYKQSVFSRLLRILRRGEPVFEWPVDVASEHPHKNLSDDEFIKIFHDLEQCCDERDSDLRDAIAYSLRMMEQEKLFQRGPSVIEKFKTTTISPPEPSTEENQKKSAPRRQ